MKLTKKQEEDLRVAIYNWIYELEIELEDGGSWGSPPRCTLCDEYLYSNDSNDCAGCPVFAYTGKSQCRGTPDAREYVSFKNRAIYTIQFGNKILKAFGLKPCILS